MFKLLEASRIKLLFLIISALGFSGALLFIRLFLESKHLSYALDYQSKIVFFSFLLQLGTRSYLRILIYNNRNERVSALKYYLYGFLVMIAILDLSFANETSNLLYGSVLVATSLELTVSVAKGKLWMVAFWSFVNFLFCFGSVIYIVLANNDSFLELSALVFLITIFLMNIYEAKERLSIKTVFYDFCSSISYMLGSSITYISPFVLIQGLLSFDLNETQILFLTDAQVAAGVFSLILTKLLLLYEKRFYETNLVFKSYCIYLLLLIMLISISSVLGILFYGNDILYYICVSLILFGKNIYGFLNQYANRKLVLNLLFVSCIGFYLYLWVEKNEFFLLKTITPALICILVGFKVLKNENKAFE